MRNGSATSWCTIHRDRISRNLDLARGLVPDGRTFCAVLKADAYGHGIAQVVPLIREQGVETVGITSNAEAHAVRDAGFDGTLIRLRAATLQEIEGALDDRVEEQVTSVTTARQLRALMDAGKLRTGVHLALNAAGMSRDALEISSADGQNTCHKILATLGAEIHGICSHFPSNEPAHLRQSADQFQQQAAWVFENSDLKRSETLVHVGSSLTLISDVDVATDMYRCGAILYGILRPDLGFRPTMDLEARVVSLQDYPQGMTVGYDRACRLDRNCRLACISIGYENGFRRVAHEGSAVAIRDTLAPVLGKISMNAIVADVTGIKDIAVGDTVGVFGEGDVTSILPETAETQFRTIMADLYTDWGQRNHRVYR
ncbi:alanine racemase [Tropicibacter sp. R16_0]|uniref:alanine racemase n=1 Tax=Tropicibacter sp. R16_0 TaxID=2821102 RepID=UPI001ADA5495|nr:alanine racemase [Tropicibacter sp. R16_0]MBO9452777.1 alanine racemase [Tropicibacter sp. R16_0]